MTQYNLSRLALSLNNTLTLPYLTLKALANRKYENPNVLCLIEFYNELLRQGKDVTLCWIPSHIGIPGNEKADKAAKQAVNKDISYSFIPFSDFRLNINGFIYNEWQSEWDQETNNKLHDIQPNVGKTPAYINNIKCDSIIRRLRIGHTYLTHGYLLRGEMSPECIPCCETFSVKHILLECIEFQDVRNEYYNANSLKELFEKVPYARIFGFLKEINLFM